MKTANLLLSAAIATLALASPVSMGDAEAGKIKIKVNATKAANVNVKPKIRIKPKITATKLATKVKIKPKLDDAEKINQEPAAAQNREIAKANFIGNGKFSANQSANGNSNRAPLPEYTDVIPQFRIDFSASADAAEAARAAAELKDTAALGALRDAASPDFGLGMPDLSREIPSNSDRLGAMGIERRGGMFPGDDLGGGPGSFGTIDNSHKGDTPGNPWGVNVDDAIAGVASTRTTTTGNDGHTIFRKTVDTETGDVTTSTDDGSFSVSKTVNTGDPGSVFIENNSRGERRSGYHTYSYVNGVIHTATHSYATDIGRGRTQHVNGHLNFGNGWATWTNERGATIARYRILQDPRDFTRADERRSGTTRLTNPDFVDNGNNCRDVGCIVRGEGGMQPLDRSKLTKAQVLPAGPDEADGGASAGGAAMFTANDVLERYDEDNRRRGAARRLDPASLCKHSEC